MPELILKAKDLTDSSTQRIMLDLIETILTYKFAQLSYQELTEMFGLSELKQTRVYQEAKEEGATETKLLIAKNFLSLGISIEQVSVATGISLAEIEKLQN